MGVHGEGQRGGAAVIGERAQHGGQLVDIGAAAAQLARHAGLDEAGRLQHGEIVGDEAILVGGFVGALGEDRAELAGDFDGALRRGRPLGMCWCVMVSSLAVVGVVRTVEWPHHRSRLAERLQSRNCTGRRMALRGRTSQATEMPTFLRSPTSPDEPSWRSQFRWYSICTAGRVACCWRQSGNGISQEDSDERQDRTRQLRPVLPGGDGRGDGVLALDRAGGARAAVRHEAVQRPAARRAADVADPAVEAAQGAGGGWRDHHHPDRTGRAWSNTG